MATMTETLNAAQIKETLERLGHGLSEADVAEAASCWEVPALILSDQGVNALSSTGELEKMFEQGIRSYRSQGFMSTRPVIEHVDMMSERLAAVDVRWPTFDKAGVEKASERSHYILRLGDDGRLRVRVALTRSGKR
jgi:hypothetical protein